MKPTEYGRENQRSTVVKTNGAAKEEIMKITDASHRKNERGNVLVYTVLSALFLFFVLGLGVDLSHLYLAKAELQNAADAAALAGAKGLQHNPVTERIQVAVDQAVNTMNLNKYNFSNRTFPGDKTTASRRALVTFGKTLDSNHEIVNPQTEAQAAADPDPSTFRFVKVSTPSVPVSIFFGNPLLGSTQTLNATATAGLSTSSSGNARFCMTPMFFYQCDPTTTCTMDTKKTEVKCGANTLPGGTYTPPGTQTYADGTTCNPLVEYCKGCAYYIRYKGGSSPAEGQFGIPSCAGAGSPRDLSVAQTLASYGNGCTACGSVTPGDTLDLAGSVPAMESVAGGLNVRFDRTNVVNTTTIAPSATTPPDTNVAQRALLPGGKDGYEGIKWSEYKAGSPYTAPANPSWAVTNRRILYVPILYTHDPQGNKIRSVGAFFMQSEAFVSNSWIRLEYVPDNVAGIVAGDPNGGGGTNIVAPVLYK